MLGPRAVALRVGALCVIGSVPAFVSPSRRQQEAMETWATVGLYIEEKEGRRRREGKEEAVAMKREKDNKFIIMNEDEISHAGMFAT